MSLPRAAKTFEYKILMSCARTGRNGTTMGFLAFILGPVMALVYQLIPNYAVTMIVFTVLVRILLLPLAMRQVPLPRELEGHRALVWLGAVTVLLTALIAACRPR